MPRFANLYEQLPGSTRRDDEDDIPLGDRDAPRFHRKILKAPAPQAHPTPHPDRALVRVVFIDIVGSTEKAVELGDGG